MSYLDSVLINRTQPNARKERIYDVSFEALAGLLRLDGKCILKMDGFPKDGRLLFAEADNARGVVHLYVADESFEEIFEGESTPIAPPIDVTRIDLPPEVTS